MAWNAATLAKQHIARKLKNTCDAWNIIAGFETIIYINKSNNDEQMSKMDSNPYPYNP